MSSEKTKPRPGVIRKYEVSSVRVVGSSGRLEEGRLEKARRPARPRRSGKRGYGYYELIGKSLDHF